MTLLRTQVLSLLTLLPCLASAGSTPAPKAAAAPAAKPAAPPQKGAEAKAPEPKKPPEPEPSLDGMMRALGPAFEKQMGQHQALRLYCDFLAARARFGRAAVWGAGEIETINIYISRAQQKAGRDAATFTQLLSEHFPRALVGSDGNLWHWQGSRYALDFPALAWDVDEEFGTLYAANLEHKMLWFDAKMGKFRTNGLEKVKDLQASDGVLYYLTTDGAVMMRQKGQSTRILQRNVEGGSLEASRRVLYLLEAGALYRYAGGAWDKAGSPIQRNVQKIAADGKDYFALDQSGHIYSSLEGRYIEKDTGFLGIWLIGKNLLGLTRAGRVLGYSADKRTWQVFRE